VLNFDNEKLKKESGILIADNEKLNKQIADADIRIAGSELLLQSRNEALKDASVNLEAMEKEKRRLLVLQNKSIALENKINFDTWFGQFSQEDLRKAMRTAVIPGHTTTTMGKLRKEPLYNLVKDTPEFAVFTTTIEKLVNEKIEKKKKNSKDIPPYVALAPKPFIPIPHDPNDPVPINTRVDTVTEHLKEFDKKLTGVIDDDQFSDVTNDYEEDATYSDQEASGIKKRGGLLSTEIEKIMRPHRKFIGVFASNELTKIPKNRKSFGFIMNTKPRHITTGGHWVAVYIDVEKDMSIEYYDSFSDSPSKQFLKDIKNVIDRLKPSVYLKFKVNKIKEQNVKTQNCGWFAMRFLINRFKGIPFKDITGYSDTVRGEKNIKKLKSTFGYI
jgi:hypothetical protein